MFSVETKLARTEADFGAEGIHLVDPSERELEMAKEDAQVKEFSTIWIHSDKPSAERSAAATQGLATPNLN